MLCWICPECGRDCSPAVRECPSCAQSEAKLTNGVLSMVELLRAVPPVRLLTSAPQQYLLFGLTNGHSHTTAAPAVVVEEGPAVPASETIDSLVRPLVESAKPAAPPQVLPTPHVAPVVRYTELAAPAEPPVAIAPATRMTELASALALPPTSTLPVEPAPAAHIANATPAVAQPPAAGPPTLAQPTAFLAPALQITQLKIPATLPTKTAPHVEPVTLPAAELATKARAPIPEPAPLSASKVKFVELPAPPNPPTKTAPAVEATKRPTAKAPTQIAPTLPEPGPFLARAFQIAKLAAPAACAVKIARAIKPATLTPARPHAAAPAFPTELAPFVAAMLRLPRLALGPEPFCAATALANRIGAIPHALEVHSETILDIIQLRIDAYESEIRTIVARFEARPAVSLLAAPSQIVAPPAPPELQWLKTPRPAIPGRKPPDVKYGSVIAPAQNIPLAGPCLPPQLRNFIEAPPAVRVRLRNGISLPAWIASLVIATTLFLGAGAGLQYLATNHDAKAATVVTAPAHAVAIAPAVPLFEQHPLARFVEVTGLRVVADLNHRSQVQYIIVNHSATPLSSMLIKIAVRSSAEPAGSAPLFTVSTVVPSLGPHQSKEIRTDLDSELRSSAIPDWEFLRTDVHVGTQN